MAHFKKDNSFSRGPRKSFGGGPRRDFNAPREMFDAECGNCHEMTQVPFRPNGSKPVFCRSCFTPDTDRAPRGRFNDRKGPSTARSFAPRPAADPRMDDIARQLNTMNALLERLVTLTERNQRSAELGEVVKKVSAPKIKKAPAKKKRASK